MVRRLANRPFLVEFPNKLGLIIGICCVLIILTSCQSGTWENDPENWERAFGAAPSPEITVINSWYWRSAHFTLEFKYFFEVTTSDKLKQELIEYNQLEKIESEKVNNVDSYFHRKPEWFVPKNMNTYEIYTDERNEFSNFKVFIDRETGHIFLTDYQF